MNRIRFGYACIKMTENKKEKEKYCVNRSCIQKTIMNLDENKNRKPSDMIMTRAKDLAKKNLESLINVINWNEENGIKLYRMSSDMFPHITNETFLKPNEDYAYDLLEFSEYFKRISELRDKYKCRLTFHPGQYNQIGAEKDEVFEKTKRDLKFHADFLDKINAPKDSIMVVHGGGTYKNKSETKKRYYKNFYKLPENVRNRIALENCERQYSVSDVLEMSQKLNIPCVWDTHHFSCWNQLYSNCQESKKLFPIVIKTWLNRNLTPKIHISEQALNKRLGAHSDYIEEIPDYVMNYIKKGNSLDIMLEAKKKDYAVKKLKNKLNF